jgi:predicted ATPase
VEGDLSGQERAVLAVLSVFAGGFTADAATAVAAAADPGIDPLDVPGVVAGLARRSLVSEPAPGRYRLAEAARRPADQALRSSPLHDAVRDAHLDWARSVAEQGAAALDGPGQHVWLDRLEAEHDNFRAALQWGTARRDREAALALAAALGRFWEVRGHAREGRRWLDLALRQNPGAPATVRANAANSAGLLAFRDRDYTAARAVYEESLALHWDLGDRLGATGVLHAMGNVAFQQRHWDEARRLFEESLSIGRELRDDRVVAASLTNLGAVAEVQGDHAQARALYDEALSLWRTVGDSFNAAAVLGNMADVAVAQGELGRARLLAAQALEARRLVGDRAGTAAALGTLAAIARRQGDAQAARSFEAERRLLASAGTGAGAGPGPAGGWLARLRRRFSP